MCIYINHYVALVLQFCPGPGGSLDVQRDGRRRRQPSQELSVQRQEQAGKDEKVQGMGRRA